MNRQELRSDELYHYGVLGMKWGVRRYQNKDGSYKSSADGRYYDKKNNKSINQQNSKKQAKKSALESKLSDKYKKAGYTNSEAEQRAKRKATIYKALAIGAGVGVTVAAGMYLKNKHDIRISKTIDQVIQSGQTLKTIDVNANADHNVFYAAANKVDENKYLGIYGYQKKAGMYGDAAGTPIYQINRKLNKDIKVACDNSARKAFDSIKDDDDIKKYINILKMNRMTGDDDYATFNKGLVLHNNHNNILPSNQQMDFEKAQQKFYNKLRESGYGALVDVNDRDYSGFKSKNPIIVFDSDIKNSSEKFVKEVTSEVTEGKFMREMAKSSITPSGVATTSVMVGALGAYKVAYDDELEIETHKLNSSKKKNKTK